MRRVLRCGAAAALIGLGTATMTVPATAQKLPWTDANPLEQIFGKPAAPKRATKPRRAPAAKAPDIAAVPVPDKRPDSGSDSASKGVAGAGTAAAVVVTAASATAAEKAEGPATPAPGTVPKPEPSPEPATAEPAGEKAVPVDAKPLPSAEPSPLPAAEGTEGQPVTEKPDIDSDAAAAAISNAPRDAVPVAPLASAPGPGDAIPVPELRPAEGTAPAATGARTAPPAAAPVPDPAPNATDKLKARTSAISPAVSVLAAAAVEDAENCEAELKRRGVEFTVAESISEGECGVLRPVNVTKLASGVKVSPKTQMLCRSALALDDWMTKGVMPAVKADLPERTLTEFRHASTYVCRPRASEKGISEHARGSAIDIAAFVFDKGDEIGVESRPAGTPEAKFQDAIRAAACGPFKTVLGPGTDSDHATHFHLDIAARNNGSTYCK